MSVANTITDRADRVDLVELALAVKRGWRALITCTVLGILAGIAVLMFAPRKFSGVASIVVKNNASSSATSLLAKLGVGDVAPAALGTPTPIETEVAILSSRAVANGVVDSLKLQSAILSPRSIAGRDVFKQLDLKTAFAKAKYTVERTDAGYRFTKGEKTITGRPGARVALDEGFVTLRSDTTLPAKFTLQLLDREDALTAFRERLGVSKTTGSEVITVSFSAPDSMTAAAVPNALIGDYLARRLTVDRGTNAHRASFIAAQLDTVGRQLSLAEDSLRRFQERSGLMQPDVQGKLQLDEAADIRTQIGTIDVERGALDQLSQLIASGKMTPRQLAAYPAFLKSPAINQLLGQLASIETNRAELLGRRLETDREVMALTQSATDIETQLKGLAASYHASLDQQRIDLSSQLDTLRKALFDLPAAAEASVRYQRQAKQLATTYSALQVQLVEARLAAIGEGGDVRQLDVATPPRKVAFPKKLLTMAIGTGAGLFLGVLMALFVGMLGRYVEDPLAIERTTGVPALRLDTSAPLLVSGNSVVKTLLLVPIDGRASTAGVAERLARVALARGNEPTVLDLSAGAGWEASGARTALTTDVNATLTRLESQHGMVIVRLPALASDETAAALKPERTVLFIAPPGRVERRALVDAIQTLRRLDVPCAGVVLNRASDATTPVRV